MNPEAMAGALWAVFGPEWEQLTVPDQDLIIRDCIEDGGVPDLAEYRRSIGAGNLQAYAETQRVRFGRGSK